MNLRTLILKADMKRTELVKHIMTMSCPDPDEIDAWVWGVFEEDPDEDHLTRQFVVFGPLKACADSVAGFASQKSKPATKLCILFAQGDIPEIECRSADLCF